jgi:hypothetical protein
MAESLLLAGLIIVIAALAWPITAAAGRPCSIRGRGLRGGQICAARRRPTEMHLLDVAMLARAGRTRTAAGSRRATGSQLSSRRFGSVAGWLVAARAGLSSTGELLPIAAASGSVGVEEGSVVKYLVRVRQHCLSGRSLHELLPFQGRTLEFGSKTRMHLPLLGSDRCAWSPSGMLHIRP